MGTRFNLSYTNQDDDSGDHIENFDMSFENPKSSSAVAHRVQKFLNAAGYYNIEVTVATSRDEEYWQNQTPVWDEQEPDLPIPRFLRKDADEAEFGRC